MADLELEKPPSGESSAPEKQPETVPISTTTALPLEPTPKKNEPASPSNPVGKIGLGDRVRRVTSKITEFANAGFKKGKGRPKKCRECNGSKCEECNWTGFEPGKSDERLPGLPISQDRDDEPEAVPIHRDNGTVAPQAQVVVATDFGARAVALLRKMAGSSLKVGIDVAKWGTGFLANKANVNADFTRKTLEKYDAKPEAIADWVEALDMVAEKRNWKPKNPEEAALILATLNLFAPFVLMSGEFLKEIHRQRTEGDK